MIMEILIPNPAVRNLIREDKIHQVYSAMQSGQDKFGMQTFNQALATAYFQKQVSLEMALQRSSNPDELAGNDQPWRQLDKPGRNGRIDHGARGGTVEGLKASTAMTTSRVRPVGPQRNSAISDHKLRRG